MKQEKSSEQTKNSEKKNSVDFILKSEKEIISVVSPIQKILSCWKKALVSLKKLNEIKLADSCRRIEGLKKEIAQLISNKKIQEKKANKLGTEIDNFYRILKAKEKHLQKIQIEIVLANIKNKKQQIKFYLKILGEDSFLINKLYFLMKVTKFNFLNNFISNKAIQAEAISACIIEAQDKQINVILGFYSGISEKEFLRISGKNIKENNKISENKPNILSSQILIQYLSADKGYEICFNRRFLELSLDQTYLNNSEAINIERNPLLNRHLNAVKFWEFLLENSQA